MKTFSAKPHEVQHDWFVVDATDKVLGRLATEIARSGRAPELLIQVNTGDEPLRVAGVSFAAGDWPRVRDAFTGWPANLVPP